MRFYCFDEKLWNLCAKRRMFQDLTNKNKTPTKPYILKDDDISRSKYFSFSQ